MSLLTGSYAEVIDKSAYYQPVTVFLQTRDNIQDCMKENNLYISIQKSFNQTK